MTTQTNNSTGVFYNSFDQPNVEQIDISGIEESEVLLTHTIILTTKISNWGAERQLADTERKKVMNGKSDSKYLKARKLLVDKKYLDKLLSVGGELRRKLYLCGFRPSFLSDGSIIVPFGGIGYAVNLIKEYQAKRNELINELIEVYAEAKLEAQAANPELYNENEYPAPEDLRNKFGIEYSMMGLGLPAGVSEYIDADLFEEQREKRNVELTQALDECRQALRSGFAEIVDAMVDKTTNLGSARKVFKKGFVERCKVYFETFDQLNLTNDVELKGLVDKARDLLDGVSPEAIRSNLEVQVKISKELGAVKDSLATMLEPRRRELRF